VSPRLRKFFRQQPAENVADFGADSGVDFYGFAIDFGKCVFSQPLRLNFAVYKSTNANAGLFDVFVEKI
jgi:hypothetical protein